MNLDMLTEIGIGLTEKEEQFLKEARDLSKRERSEGGLSAKRMVIEMYSVKHAEKNTNALINSNKELAISTGKHADAMRHLTTALLIVAGLQVVLFAIQLWQSYQ